jgi:hypothetical protein
MPKRYQVYVRANVEIVQVALVGRAARRMQEATGRPATTIASLLRGWKGNNTEASVVVVDEASMVDIISMHRLSIANDSAKYFRSASLAVAKAFEFFNRQAAKAASKSASFISDDTNIEFL